VKRSVRTMLRREKVSEHRIENDE